MKRAKRLPPPANATESFSGIAEVYARHRPDYAPDSVRFLRDNAGLTSASVVVDVGSGTGIFSRRLLDGGLRVIGVEPNDDMRAEAESVLAGRPWYSSRNGTAEATGLPDRCADLVTAAQAFHWFDKPRFRAECRRLVRNDAPVAIVWNVRETTDALARGLVDVCRDHCPGFTGLERGVTESTAEYPLFYRGGAYLTHTFRNDFTWDWPAFLGRSLSSSYAPRKDDRSYAPFVADMRLLFERHQRDGAVQIANVTLCLLGRV